MWTFTRDGWCIQNKISNCFQFSDFWFFVACVFYKRIYKSPKLLLKSGFYFKYPRIFVFKNVISRTKNIFFPDDHLKITSKVVLMKKESLVIRVYLILCCYCHLLNHFKVLLLMIIWCWCVKRKYFFCTKVELY